MEKSSLRLANWTLAAALLASAGGCMSAQDARRSADQTTDDILKNKYDAALGRNDPLSIERPADTLRRRLLLEQGLVYGSPASLGVQALKPIPHWPKDDYLTSAGQKELSTAEALPLVTREPLRIGLLEAIQIGARNNSQYQAEKESVYRAALDLDLFRDEFRTTWIGIIDNGVVADWSGDEFEAGAVVSPSVGFTQRFKNGLNFTTRLALDLAKLLTGDRNSSFGIASDTSITFPLLRGAGRHIVTEPLTQAERNVIYAIYDFEEFKREFAVEIASQYLEVLQGLDEVQNEQESYRRLVLAARRSSRLAAAGRLPEIQVDQAVQQELSARDSWIRAIQDYNDALDEFKQSLGLPPDALIELDREVLTSLSGRAQKLLAAAPAATTAPSPEAAIGAPATPTQPTTAPTTQEIEIEMPSMKGAGPYELAEERAIRLALDNRLDLRVVEGQVADAQRRVVVAADDLRPGLGVVARASFGDRRGIGSADSPNAQLRPERGIYSLSAPLELPLERTSERNNYREALIALESAVRNVQELEDQVKLLIRSELRGLLAAREAVVTESTAVALARRRVESTDVLLQAGRAEIRDVLEAQTDLVEAQNDFTAAIVEYRISELELQRAMGVLQVTNSGVWQEFDPAAEASTLQTVPQ